MAWMVCLTMASCTNQEIIEQVVKPVHSNTLNVLTEKQESRSVLSYEGTFYWTENDYIGVYGTETENARFHFTSQADGVSTFTGNMNASEEKVSWAYFPYSEKVDVNKKQLSFPMPAERTVSNENHSPMIGRIEANNTVRFYHTGGILHLKIVGLPEHAAQLVITSEGENSPCLAGTAVIDDITADGCTYRIDNGSKEVVYDVRNLEGGEYIHTIYLPLQVGTYEKIKVALKNEVGGIIKERSLSNLIVTRGKMTETPTLHFSDKIYAYKFADESLDGLDWTDAIIFSNNIFLAYNEKTRELIITDIDEWKIDEKQVLWARFDEKGKLEALNLNGFFACLTDYTETTVDVTLVYEGSIEHYDNQKLSSSVQSRSTIQIDLGIVGAVINDVFNVIDFIGAVSPHGVEGWLGTAKYVDGLSDITENKVQSALLIDGMVLVGTAFLAPQFYGVVALAAFKGMLETIISAFLESSSKYIYSSLCGAANVVPIDPLQIDDGHFKLGYRINNTSTIPEILDLGILSIPIPFGYVHGIIVEKWPISKNSVYRESYLTYNNVNAEKAIVEFDVSKDNKFDRTLSFERGYTYYMKAFLGLTNGGSVLPFFYFSDMEKITFDDAKIEKVTSKVNFANGSFHFDVNAVASCSDDSKAWNMALYKNEKLIDAKSWSKKGNEVSFNVKVNPYDMDYLTKGTKDNWKIGIMSNTQMIEEPISIKEFDLKYETNPSIDLDVQIIDGPRLINNSRAADDDDEEKYYVKYQVTAKTEGSGWIEQVKINVDGRPVKTGKPKNEGESFTYTGSKTYKDKSELPTISCEGILINGAGNIQSVPTSISIASRL